ncbi:Glycosyl hydrolases family 32 N-terminal domain-containing protein [Paenibacillus catalpae]|uniref:Glycosyl hydrolases family 32 N-terminal domain-containing protein n=1 Tax=Paenibacillus catalpae TaxID=1045775 RepID=A0A1I1V302_9BACL|nr:hypothetical protein [Paenibacillus catalpae]SFD77279.1 Glycosyl hydrolases family 32 N-terminal domain-containing protein [Paenibacillus catalpae]
MATINRDFYEHLRTDYKREIPVLAGSGEAGAYDAWAVDCPFVFYHKDKFYMMHIGFDGLGYRTALATSDDLVEWKREAVILDRGKDALRWDHVGAAGSWILLESNDLYELPRLKKIDNKYWMIYHSYPEYGYEAGGAKMGLAWCEDESLLEWHRLDEPIFSYENGGEWEKAGLYKCCFLESAGRYWMFYNAKDNPEWLWKEETGIAVSDDMRNWNRLSDKPVLMTQENTFYRQYVSDPYIRFDSRTGFWVNFAFGYDGENAQGLLAVSHNLTEWMIDPEPWIRNGEPGQLDATHAHKSSVIYWKDRFYHFYCACRPSRSGDPASIESGNGEFRCIALATSAPLDKRSGYHAP